MKQISLNYFKVVLFLLFPSLLLSQEVLEGRTINEDTGAIVPFVNVIEKGTSNGTTSDADGNFRITVESLPTTLVFSYIGFETQELLVTENSPLTVRFSESAAALDEVIITGLASSTKRANAANAVASISADELTGVTVQSGMDAALSGKFNGAEIKANSGAPGGGISMRLRGVTSIFGDQQPLFIVDGVYVDNSSISLGNNIVS